MDQTIQGLKLVLPGLGFIPVAGEYLKSSIELIVALYEFADVSVSRMILLIRLIEYL
jgi:hypothetical protein